jgi:hypothetical protein
MQAAHPGTHALLRLVQPAPGMLRARYLFLRALGLVFFSAFGSLAFQIHALVGDRGILPAGALLEAVRRAEPGIARFLDVPTLLWLSTSDRALSLLVGAGLAGSLALFLNVAPRASAVLCTVLYVSWVSVGRDFAGYQSEGMLVEAGVAAALLAPRGFRPALGAAHPPTLVAVALLRWEWFRIWFESGIAKLASGDPEWRSLRAMDHYYETGPLPTWLAWWAHHLPRSVHTATTLVTLLAECGLVLLPWFFPRSRKAVVLLCTLFQLGILLTANYAFINWITLALGLLWLDDDALARVPLPVPEGPAVADRGRLRRAVHGVLGAWLAYASLGAFAFRGMPRDLAWVAGPATVLRPFRLANAYGLFAVMTPGRFEIEVQGSRDGTTWTPYPFRYKPQDPREAPGFFAPYQPRFDWNLWFCSLGTWEDCPLLFEAEARLLQGEPHVTALFRADPFHGDPPRFARAVLFQYWFTTPEERVTSGAWWRREELGPFGPTLERAPDGSITLVAPATIVEP